jgi:TnpA family transposase
MRVKLKKIEQQKLWLKDETESQKNFNKMTKKKIKIKRISTKIKKQNI